MTEFATRAGSPGSDRASAAPDGREPVTQAASEARRPLDGAGANGAEAPALPALVLREALPQVTDTTAGLARGVAALGRGTGPIAVDTERASGYRYGQRAYLIQLRREGSGTLLVDPIGMADLSSLSEALTGPEWVLHAASQDLPCLAELDLRPVSLFDTELAGRLLGMPRVGLATMVNEVLGRSLRKGHGAADWSSRPLPEDWLEYAALDVEVLIELRALLHAQLESAGKLAWAEQEFSAIRDMQPPPPRPEPWRRTSGLHRVRAPRGLAIVASMWEARDQVARESDTAPGRLLPDSAIVAAGVGIPKDLPALLALPEFRGRGAMRFRRTWAAALHRAWELDKDDLPVPNPPTVGPPPARLWSQRQPAAAERLERARAALHALAAELVIPVENLLQPDLVRRLLWDPEAHDRSQVAEWLAANGARPWQVDLTTDILSEAVRR